MSNDNFFLMRYLEQMGFCQFAGGGIKGSAEHVILPKDDTGKLTVKG